jgi:predicted  nucleic acid-binding Zn-ribbon protein
LFGVVINAYFLALSELRRDVESAHQSLAAVEGEFTALSTQASGLREKLEHSEKQFDVFKNRFFADFEGFLSFDTTEERLKRLEDIVLGQEEEKPLKSESIDRRLERIEWLLQKHFNDF